MESARRYFRAVEAATGWECHQGSSVLDSHGTLDDALDHLSDLGEVHAPAEVFAHHLDGTVKSVAIFD